MGPKCRTRIGEANPPLNALNQVRPSFVLVGFGGVVCRTQHHQAIDDIQRLQSGGIVLRIGTHPTGSLVCNMNHLVFVPTHGGCQFCFRGIGIRHGLVTSSTTLFGNVLIDKGTNGVGFVAIVIALALRPFGLWICLGGSQGLLEWIAIGIAIGILQGSFCGAIPQRHGLIKSGVVARNGLNQTGIHRWAVSIARTSFGNAPTITANVVDRNRGPERRRERRRGRWRHTLGVAQRQEGSPSQSQHQ
mmetsp:Transcript_22030/g.50757  ORF Transcript_22030/g.50757 Transcript_22030/m.50757 type:complete len:246 (-) Transcript_22030:200-937(-)